MFDTFYNVMIRPVEYLIEIIFTIMYSLLGHEGYTLIGMSIAVSTLVLPLYARAEAIQAAYQGQSPDPIAYMFPAV